MLLSCFSRGRKFSRTTTSVSFILPRYMTDDITMQINITPSHFNLFQIGAKVNITHNVKMFRISLPNPESSVDFTSIPSYVILKTDDKSNNNNKDGNRTSYTPISYSDQKGYFDILIKNNLEDAVAGHMHTMPEGGFVSVKGPFAYDSFQYHANMRDTIHMIAGGSGISVMLQIIREIFRQEQNEDKTKVRLLYANSSEIDAALRVAFDDLHYNLPDRFEVTYLFENKVEESDSVLSSEYIPRLSGDEQQLEGGEGGHDHDHDDDGDGDGEEYEYVMMPQMIQSVVTSEVVKAFLSDEFTTIPPSGSSTATAGAPGASSGDEEDYYKPLILVCGPPRMVELVAGRGGARATANRLRKTRRKASGADNTTTSTSTSTTPRDCPSDDMNVVGGILGELRYTGAVVQDEDEDEDEDDGRPTQSDRHLVTY